MKLTDREKEVLQSIPSDDWVDQFTLATSKLVLSKLFDANLVERKIIPNPSRDPRKGMVYRRVTKS